jgi:hypothetical protein
VYTSKVPRRALSLPLRVVSHYANVRPTPETWRRDVLGPFRHLILGNATIPDKLPVFGVQSFEQLEQTLGEFREVLDRVSKLKPSHMDAARDLTELISKRSGLRLKRHIIDRPTQRLSPQWDTETQSFCEMLYAYVVLAFSQVPVQRLRRCVACGIFFFAMSPQRPKYCTGRCQIRTAMKTYRSRHRRAKATSNRGRPGTLLHSPSPSTTTDR